MSSNHKMSWGLFSTILAGAASIVTIIAFLTNINFRCTIAQILNLESSACKATPDYIDVSFIIQTTQQEPIEGASVTFIFKGSPEVRTTTKEGYVKNKIPFREDVDVIISKEGYETINRTLNLDKNRDDKPVIYQLKQKQLSSSTEQPTGNPTGLPTTQPTPSPTSPSTDSPIFSPLNPSIPVSTKLTQLNCNPSLPAPYLKSIGISKKILYPSFYMVYDFEGRETTCELKNNSYGKQFTKLNLAFGISPNNHCRVASYVALFLDSTKVEEYNLPPGKLVEIKQLDVTNAKYFTIVFKGQRCSSDGGVHFDATLS